MIYRFSSVNAFHTVNFLRIPKDNDYSYWRLKLSKWRQQLNELSQ
jgi:hypothetical protein